MEPLFVAAAIAVAFLVAARSWPRRAARPPDAPPPPGPPVPGVPYRAPPIPDPPDGAGGAPEGDGEEDGGVAEEGDGLEPRARALWRAWRASHHAADGAAMVRLGRAALAEHGEEVGSLARHVIAHGHALSGETQLAIDAVLGMRGEDAAVAPMRVEVLRLARRYRPALQLLRDALGETSDPTLVAIGHRLVEEAPRWERALRLLGAPEELAPDDDFELVREAGRVKGRNDDAARIGERIFERAPDPDLAWVIAECWARAFDRERAEAWLLRAAGAGSRDVERFEASAELAALRATAAGARVRAALGGDELPSPPPQPPR